MMALDHDADGDTDLFVANDSMPNFLWENDGKGAFREVAFARGVSHDANGREMAAMGIAAGDLNGDLRDDLFVTVFSGEATPLYCSTKSGGYRERGMAAGISGPSIPLLGWGAAIEGYGWHSWRAQHVWLALCVLGLLGQVVVLCSLL